MGGTNTFTHRNTKILQKSLKLDKFINLPQWRIFDFFLLKMQLHIQTMNQEAGGGPPSSGNAKKKRRTSQNTSVSVNQPSPGDMHMMGDTVFAGNPFDDGPGGMGPMGGQGMMDPRRGPMMGPGGPMGPNGPMGMG